MGIYFSKRDGYTFILVVSFVSLVLGIAGKKDFSLVGILFNIIFLFLALDKSAKQIHKLTIANINLYNNCYYYINWYSLRTKKLI